ncbi:MAG: VWA domain-containing protein [Bacteroidetes bacterium]|nr:VWA domain-containing protein [Bacteroidota bacterium]HET6243663.1 VWA domain-containing protein [Bacteroidia bacterium]
MVKFANIEYLYALLLIPLLLIIYWLMLRWKKKSFSAFGDLAVISQLMPAISPFRANWKTFLQLSGLVLLILAIAAPQTGSKMEEVKREGVDLVVALDISNSMLAEDLSPNRLERAKRALLQLIDDLKGDRIGIVVFAGEAYVQLPITTDYGAAKMFINTINTEIIPTQGTAIGNAIDLSLRSFGEITDEVKNKSRVIVVISDGEDHQDDPLELAKEATKKGVVIHTVGFGSPKGAPIPIYRNGKPAGFRMDKEGNTVVTSLDETTLQQIAQEANGIYVRATNSQAGLSLILDEINKMDKQEYESSLFSDYEDQFQYFIALALLLFTLDFLLPERKSKWYGKINLFGKK